MIGVLSSAYAGSNRRLFGIALVVVFHLVLWLMATRPVQRPAVRDDRVWVSLRWLQQPLPNKLAVVPVIPRPTPKPAIPKPTPPAAVASEPAPAIPAPAVTVDSPEEQALQAAPGAPGDVVQRSFKAVADVDRQLRSEHRQGFTAPVDTPQARLARGFAAAHAAVPPKWFEQARTELISAPNDPKHIYRVTTAMGEYCVYYPDKASMTVNTGPKAGTAAYGEPLMARCPHPF